jgi:hypothetical protein
MELNKPCDNCHVVYNIRNSHKSNLFKFFTPKKPFIIWFCSLCLKSDTHLRHYLNEYKHDILVKINNNFEKITKKLISKSTKIIKYNDFINNNPLINNGDYIQQN